MKTIWKWTLKPACEISMPDKAKILTVQVQNGEPQLWATVDTNEPTVLRKFCTYGTGHTLPDNPGEFIGSFQLADGALVFHVFEQTNV